MKLPFNQILSPILKPTLRQTRQFCYHPAFSMSIYYTYFYGILGCVTNANHLRKHLGEPVPNSLSYVNMLGRNNLMLHDLKIIATTMGLMQYACLIAGCLTANPSLFLPHLLGQLGVVVVKVVNALVALSSIKTCTKLLHKIPTIILLLFNWCQEFCVFRQYLCICDL